MNGCNSQPDLAMVGLAESDPEKPWLRMCILSEGHAGPHESVMGSQRKFGYMARLSWIDAFEGLPTFPDPHQRLVPNNHAADKS